MMHGELVEEPRGQPQDAHTSREQQLGGLGQGRSGSRAELEAGSPQKAGPHLEGGGIEGQWGGLPDRVLWSARGNVRVGDQARHTAMGTADSLGLAGGS